MPRVLGLDAWKTLARAGEPPADALLRKQYIADHVKVDTAGGSRKISFTISTAAVDRDRDTLAVDGWRLENYRKNPVVLWAHDSRDLPIARAEAIGVSAGQLKARADFVPAEDYPFAETVYRLLKGGFLKATSVGFFPVKMLWNEERLGFDFAEQELLEFSVCPVPSNPDALADAKASGVPLAPLHQWAERTLDELQGPGMWVLKAQAQHVFDLLKTPAVVVPAPMAVRDAVLAEFTKRGRVLSAANESRIRNARDASDAICAALDEVLATTAAQEEEPVPAPAAPPEPKAAPVLWLAAAAPPAPMFAVDPLTVRAAVVAAVTEAVRSQVNEARGRLD